jgi:hypothetical protein
VSDCGQISDVLAQGAFAVGGVVLGAALTWVIGSRQRAQDRIERREENYSEREFQAIQKLDVALVDAQRILAGLGDEQEMQDRFESPHRCWEDGWVAYSARLRSHELVTRYKSVGTMLDDVRMAREEHRGAAFFVQRSIANARVAMAWYSRGEAVPQSAFPESDLLIQMLGRGDGTDDPYAELRDWTRERPLPQFHPPGPGSTERRH